LLLGRAVGGAKLFEIARWPAIGLTVLALLCGRIRIRREAGESEKNGHPEKMSDPQLHKQTSKVDWIATRRSAYNTGGSRRQRSFMRSERNCERKFEWNRFANQISGWLEAPFLNGLNCTLC